METPLNNNDSNHLEENKQTKPEVKVYEAKVVNENENIYRERTTTIKEKEIIGNERPRSSLSQMILAFCAFITITFAVYDKVLKPYFQEQIKHPIVVANSGNIQAQITSCKNNGKFVLLDCQVTNKSDAMTVQFFNEGKIIDASGLSASKVFIQPDGSSSFNISDTSEKTIELPKDIPVRIRLMYDFKTKEEDMSYASFATSLGKIEFRNFSSDK